MYQVLAACSTTNATLFSSALGNFRMFKRVQQEEHRFGSRGMLGGYIWWLTPPLGIISWALKTTLGRPIAVISEREATTTKVENWITRRWDHLSLSRKLGVPREHEPHPSTPCSTIVLDAGPADNIEVQTDDERRIWSRGDPGYICEALEEEKPYNNYTWSNGKGIEKHIMGEPTENLKGCTYSHIHIYSPTVSQPWKVLAGFIGWSGRVGQR